MGIQPPDLAAGVRISVTLASWAFQPGTGHWQYSCNDNANMVSSWTPRFTSYQQFPQNATASKVRAKMVKECILLGGGGRH